MMAFIPVTITNNGFVSPVEYHGSAHISALSKADGIVTIPIGKQTLEKREIVIVQHI